MPEIAMCLNAGGMNRIDAESETLIAHSLRAEGFDASEDRTGRGTPIVPVHAFNYDQSERTRSMGEREEQSPTLRSTGGVAVAFQEAQTGCREYQTAGTLRADGPGHDPVGTRVRSGMAVRRLTPVECERLQGQEDGYTDIPGAADGPRYRALGNSMAKHVIRWIGLRIIAANRSAQK